MADPAGFVIPVLLSACCLEMMSWMSDLWHSSPNGVMGGCSTCFLALDLQKISFLAGSLCFQEHGSVL